MTTVAGIFISAPHDGQIYVAERSRCHSGLGTFATSPMSALRPPSGRVEMWRGGSRLNISVSASFV